MFSYSALTQDVVAWIDAQSHSLKATLKKSNKDLNTYKIYKQEVDLLRFNPQPDSIAAYLKQYSLELDYQTHPIKPDRSGAGYKGSAR